MIGGSIITAVALDVPSCSPDPFSSMSCIDNVGFVIYIFGTSVIAPITGTIALSHTISSGTARRKAIRTINDLHAQDLGIQDDDWKIDLKVNTGGVGMVLTF